MTEQTTSTIREYRKLRREIDHAEAIHLTANAGMDEALRRAHFMVEHKVDIDRLDELATRLDEEKIARDCDLAQSMRAVADGWQRIGSAP